MLDRLFITRADTVPSTALRRPRKGAIIGAGQVGMACAYSLLIQGTFNEMVLVDIAREKLEGEVMDLVHGLSFVEPATVKAGEIADCQGADIVIITAGAKQNQARRACNCSNATCPSSEALSLHWHRSVPRPFSW